MADEDDGFMALFGAEAPEPEKPKPKPAAKSKKKAPEKPTYDPGYKPGDFKTTRRVVGGEERSEGQYRAAMVFGGMILEIPEDAFLGFLRGMEGNGWSALRYDEHQDIVGGMREMARRMGIAPRNAAQRTEKRAEEKPEDEPDLDKLLDEL